MVTEGAEAAVLLLVLHLGSVRAYPHEAMRADQPRHVHPQESTLASSVLHKSHAFPVLYPVLRMLIVTVCRYFPKGSVYYRKAEIRGSFPPGGRQGKMFPSGPQASVPPPQSLAHSQVLHTDPPFEHTPSPQI